MGRKVLPYSYFSPSNKHKCFRQCYHNSIAVEVHNSNSIELVLPAMSIYYPYGKAVFVQISDEYAANILRTALFTVIVRYIFTSCRGEYPANKVGLTKK